MRSAILILIISWNLNTWARVLKLPNYYYEPSYHELIFSPELSKEFKAKYFEKFGTVDAEALADPFSFDSSTAAEKRKIFAEYMVKRLSEWHAEHYINNEPQLRPLLEVKEKLTHAQVQVTQSSHLVANYSIVGNFLEIIFAHPEIEAKALYEMNPRSFGPGAVKEARFIAQKNLENERRIRATYQQHQGIAIIELISSWSRWSSSWGASQQWKSNDFPAESKLLFGLARGF